MDFLRLSRAASESKIISPRTILLLVARVCPSRLLNMEAAWDLMRHLCRHYADCLMLEDSPSLRVRAESLNQTFAMPQELPVWKDLADGRRWIPNLNDGGAQILAARRPGDQDVAWLGYPLAITASRSGQAWGMPVFAMPVQVVEGNALVVVGPLMANAAWLEEAFATQEERLCFAQAVGLVERRGDQALSPNDDVPAMLGKLTQLLSDSMREALEGPLGQANLRGLRPGIYHRAVLISHSGSRYHRTVVRELRAISEARDDTLASTALAPFFQGPHFCQEAPKAACLAVLDPSQHEALTRGLKLSLTVVTGPPGCGKSEVVRHLLINQALLGRPTLLASRNHRALDAVEPGLNSLISSGRFVVRTVDRESKASWRDCLAEILERPAGRDDASFSNHLGILHQHLSTVTSLETDLEHWWKLSRQYEDLSAQASQALAALPLHLRSPEARARWQADTELLSSAEAALGHNRNVGFWRRLRGNDTDEADDPLRRLSSLAPPPFAERPLPDPSAEPEVWKQAIAIWKTLAHERKISKELIHLQEHLSQLSPQASTLAELVAAEDQLRLALRRVLGEIAVGNHAVLSLEERRHLSALRAAIGTLGPEPWEKAVAAALPVVTRFHPLWATSNLSVGSTVPLAPGIFDLVIIDEASQCDIPSVIPLLYRAKRSMVVGDPRQLRHISRLGALAERRLLQRHKLIDLDTQRFGHGANSCFDLAATIAEPLLLDRHYRSHASIIERASRAFYQGRLQVATDEDRLANHGAAWRWLDTVGPLTAMPSGVTSVAECEAIVALLQDLQQQNFTGTIGVAAPFRAQVELLDHQIRSTLDPVFCQKSRLLVATAHGFQGDERDAVAFSLCAGPDLPPGSAHFLSSTPNLLNVALTRARSLLAVVGNRSWAKEQGPIFLRRLAADPETEPAIPAANPYESPAEARFARALEDAGIRTIPQHPVAGRRLDLAIPDLHLDIEVDGTATHRSITGHRVDDDVWRDRVLIRRGWTILRFWTFDLDRDLPACVAKVQAEVDRLRRWGNKPSTSDFSTPSDRL